MISASDKIIKLWTKSLGCANIVARVRALKRGYVCPRYYWVHNDTQRRANANISLARWANPLSLRTPIFARESFLSLSRFLSVSYRCVHLYFDSLLRAFISLLIYIILFSLVLLKQA